RSQNVENHDKVRGMFFERAAKSVKNMKKSCRLPKREHSHTFRIAWAFCEFLDKYVVKLFTFLEYVVFCK
ncbi:MAG: hypothetical protein LBB87_04535, partial [Nitrososphaerota archaeon]|nr:hypothetical protein [Nitrososphaerota archaeon]